MEVAALIFGIVALLLSWVPLLGLILGIVPLVLGVVSRKKLVYQGRSTGLSTAGIILGVVCCIGGLTSTAIGIGCLGSCLGVCGGNEPVDHRSVQSIEPVPHHETHTPNEPHAVHEQIAATPMAPNSVDVTLHVMSQCPYGVKTVDTMTSLVRKLQGRATLSLEYIGRDQNGTLSSMHGPSELMGDKIQLCVREHASYNDWLSFLDCQNRAWRQIPEGWQSCATLNNVPMAQVSACVNGPQGDSLARVSFERSVKAGARGSPTIFIAGKKNQGARTEDAFGRAICASLTEPRPAFCSGLSSPAAVPVTILSDVRCEERQCKSMDRFDSFLDKQLPGAVVTKLDYSSNEGKALWARVFNTLVRAEQPKRAPGLPLALFGPAVVREDVFDRLKRRLDPMGQDYVYVMGSFDPTGEICNNGIDDDANGAADCRDSSCQTHLSCQPHKARHLTMYAMSQCPFAVKRLVSMQEVLDRFGRNRRKIQFTLEFVGTVSDTGSFSSMHGQAEVDEDLRQICAQHHYGQSYAFMDYVVCRGRNIQSTDWQACATGPIKASVIRSCAEGQAGRRLLKASFERAKELGFRASPTWVLNGNKKIAPRDTGAILSDFCRDNPSPECG